MLDLWFSFSSHLIERRFLLACWTSCSLQHTNIATFLSSDLLNTHGRKTRQTAHALELKWEWLVCWRKKALLIDGA